MNIAIASDLHLEFEHRGRPDRMTARRPDGHPALGPDWLPARHQGVDLILLAGDIDAGATALHGVAYAQQVAQWVGCPVAMIAGNHEFNDQEPDALTASLREASARADGVIWLENDAVDLPAAAGAVRLLGCTLWTDFALFGSARAAEAMQLDANRPPDMTGGVLHGPRRRFPPPTAVARHRRSLAWLNRQMAMPFDGLTIVMTHHAPSLRSIPPIYHDNLAASAYASHLDDKVAAWQPDLWVHGHVHAPADYVIGGTRVLCNPRGYVGRESVAAAMAPRVIRLDDPCCARTA